MAPALLSTLMVLRSPSVQLHWLGHPCSASRPKFADLLGIPPTTLKNYELGYREIGGGLFLLIANHPALTEHSQWLLTGINANQQQGA